MSTQCYGNLNIIIFLCQSLLFCFLSRNVSKTTKSIFTESSWVTQEDRVEALNVNGNALERKRHSKVLSGQIRNFASCSRSTNLQTCTSRHK